MPEAIVNAAVQPAVSAWENPKTAWLPAHDQLIEGWLSVAVMGSCGIGHFARGLGAVGLGCNKRTDSGARSGPWQMHVPSARSTADQFGDRTAGLYGKATL